MEQENQSTPMLPKEILCNIKHKYLDIPYANQSKAQTLDIYLPDHVEEKMPVVIFIHGGAFQSCDKRDMQVKPYLKVLEHGYVLVSLNYRLSGEAIFPAGIMDCKAAIRYIKAHSKDYHIDPARIAVAGGSSGANYTLMIATTPNINELEDKSLGNAEYDTSIQCAVTWFPPTDFLQMDDMLVESGLGHNDHNFADSPESLYLGGQITELDYDYVQIANPMTYIMPQMPPILMQHGLVDVIVPYQQSKIFAEKAKEIAGEDRVIFEILEKADHADPLFETRENMERVIRFLDGCLKADW